MKRMTSNINPDLVVSQAELDAEYQILVHMTKDETLDYMCLRGWFPITIKEAKLWKVPDNIKHLVHQRNLTLPSALKIQAFFDLVRGKANAKADYRKSTS